MHSYSHNTINISFVKRSGPLFIVNSFGLLYSLLRPRILNVIHTGPNKGVCQSGCSKYSCYRITVLYIRIFIYIVIMATKYDPSIEEQKLPSPIDSFREEDPVPVSDDALRVDTDEEKDCDERKFYRFVDNFPEELKGKCDPTS